MKIADTVAVALCALALAVTLGLLLFSEPLEALKLALVLLLPFIAVTLLRHLINAPRPYELFELTVPRHREGHSFPSRHVFSAFAIGTALIFYGVPLGVCTLALGVLIAVLRTLLGLHFIRDTVAGALIGVSTSLIGMLIF